MLTVIFQLVCVTLMQVKLVVGTRVLEDTNETELLGLNKCCLLM